MHITVFQSNRTNEVQKNVQYLGQEYKYTDDYTVYMFMYVEYCSMLDCSLLLLLLFLLVTGRKFQSVVWECFQD